MFDYYYYYYYVVQHLIILLFEQIIFLQDAVVDDTWFGLGDFHARRPTGIKWTKKILEAETKGFTDSGTGRRSFFTRWMQARQDRVLLERLVGFFVQHDLLFLSFFFYFDYFALMLESDERVGDYSPPLCLLNPVLFKSSEIC